MPTFALLFSGTLSCLYGGPLFLALGVTAFALLPILFLARAFMNDHFVRSNETAQPQLAPSRRRSAIPSLIELSARSIDRATAWNFLATLHGVAPTPESAQARTQVAARLVQGYPYGLDAHMKKLIQRAGLVATVEAHYATKRWNERTMQDRQPLLELEV